MKRLFKVLVLTLAILTGIGEGYSAYLLWGSSESPMIRVDKMEVDFGTIPVGLKMIREVHITNRGHAALTIDKLQTGCGCTEVVLSQNVIGPSESATLRITLRGDGSIAKAVAIYIFSNDPQQPVCELFARFNSITQSFVEPKELDFGRIDRTSQLPSKRSIRLFLKQELGVDVDITHLSVRSEEPFLSIDEAKPAEGNMKEIWVSLLQEVPTGDIHSQLELDDTKNSISMRMNICGYVRGEFFALPQMVSFGPIGRQSEAVVETILLKRRNGSGGSSDERAAAFNIESSELSKALEGLVSITNARTDMGVAVSMVVTPTKYPGTWSDRQVDGHLRMQCVGDDGYREVLNIPIGVALRLPKIRD